MFNLAEDNALAAFKADTEVETDVLDTHEGEDDEDLHPEPAGSINPFTSPGSEWWLHDEPSQGLYD